MAPALVPLMPSIVARFFDGRASTVGWLISSAGLGALASATYLSLQPASAGPGPFKVSSAATLVGLEAPPVSKNLEIKPYAICRVATDRRASPALDNDPDGDKSSDKVNYVKTALDEILAGQPVATPQTKPYGCDVKYKD